MYVAKHILHFSLLTAIIPQNKRIQKVIILTIKFYWIIKTYFKVEKRMQNFGLLPQCSWDLHSSQVLCSIDWQLGLIHYPEMLVNQLPTYRA